MSSTKRVLVVGGGIGGLCTAIALRQKNMDVDLVEVKSNWTVYGVGIIQQSNVVREMSRLGVLQKYLRAAYAFEEVGMYTPAGQLVVKIPGQRLAGPEFPSNVGISRLALHNVLVETARELGSDIRLGVTVAELSQDDDGVDVSFTDGTSERYDLVVGADGVYSKMRQMIFGDKYRPRFTGQGVWRYNFPRDPSVDHLAVCAMGDTNAGLVPLADDLMYVYVTSHEPDNKRYEESEMAENLRRLLSRFGGLIGSLKDQVTENAGVVYKPLEAVFVDENWYQGRVLLVGDAAHATTPHLGQGAGMAIEDALVLAEELAAQSSVEDGLACFMDRRFDRCKYISEMSVLAGQKEIEKDESFDRVGLTREMLEVTAKPI